ncbi:MAG TPA: class I SAM-dependent methyltransferase [Phycisphaerales bacterium]|nr:class I SAM-dependent methyltransferase [Phycisphaerales bacterium]
MGLPESNPFDRFGPTSPDRPLTKTWVARHSPEFLPGPVDKADHPTQWHFPKWLVRDDIPWLAKLKALYADPISFPASMSPEAGLLLFSLVRNIRPRTVVEVGSFLGVSTIWIAAALEEIGDDPAHSGDAKARPGALVSIDDFAPVKETEWRRGSIRRDRKAIVQENIEDAGLSHRVHLEQGTSWEVLSRICQSLLDTGGVQLALLDGDHGAKGLRQDLIELEPALEIGGYVVVHDTIPERCGGHVGGRHLLEHINDFAAGLYESVEVCLSPVNYGLGLFRRMG